MTTAHVRDSSTMHPKALVRVLRDRCACAMLQPEPVCRSSRTNIEIFLKGHAGARDQTDRVTREHGEIEPADHDRVRRAARVGRRTKYLRRTVGVAFGVLLRCACELRTRVERSR